MSQWNKKEIERLAQSLASTVKGVKPAKLQLRLVEPPKPHLFDSITREACVRRIRFLARNYQLGWLLDQETFDTPGVDTLPDARIAAILKTLEHARECIADGVSLDEAGLVRNTAHHLHRLGIDDHA